MRLIQWNCQGAFRNKNKRILSLNPEILVIPECEHPSKLKFGKLTPTPSNYFWYGDSQNKGIGIFSYSDFKIELINSFNSQFRYVIPLKISNFKYTFILFAIWAMDNKENPSARYIGQVWSAINYYTEHLKKSSILIGDFNSNKIWDSQYNEGNHTDVVNKLKELNIFSLYHSKKNVEHGFEPDPTFFMNRNKTKPYHIDYCFVSQEFLNLKCDIKLGQFKDWSELSDHVPIIAAIENNIR